MVSCRGYALFETLLASLILASGLVGVASIFSVTVGVNHRNHQRTAATLLLYDKMEQLRSGESPSGGSLDPASRADGFFEYIRVAGDGAMIVDNTDPRAPFLRLWQVQTSGASPLSVAVFGKIGSGGLLELARATSRR